MNVIATYILFWPVGSTWIRFQELISIPRSQITGSTFYNRLHYEDKHISPNDKGLMLKW